MFTEVTLLREFVYPPVHGYRFFIPASYQDATLLALCSGFVRGLFGVCSKKGGIFRTTPEQTPNKVRTKSEQGTSQVRSRYKQFHRCPLCSFPNPSAQRAGPGTTALSLVKIQTFSASTHPILYRAASPPARLRHECIFQHRIC